MDEALLFQTRTDVTQSCPPGMQFCDGETHTYYSITRVDYADGIYSVWGKQIDIPELTDDSE